MNEQTENQADGSPAEAAPRAGIVAVLGRANAGKSTLVNALLGEKVSIVSPVAQTTRNTVRGILTEPRGQMVFLDTPGVHRAESDLGRMMNRRARAAAEGTDVLMPVWDTSSRPSVEDEGWMRRLLAAPAGEAALRPVLNKVDAGGKHADAYAALWTKCAEEAGVADPAPPAQWPRVSGLTGEGVDFLRDALFALLPEHPPLFPPDVLTDFPRKLAIADVVREKLLLRLFDEVPHGIAVRVEEILEQEDGWTIAASVYVERSSQKGIVIGHKGRVLRAVRRAAEAEITSMYGHPARLLLMVKVEKNWRKNFWFLQQLGYAE